MKTRFILLGGILLATAVPAFAQNTSDMQGMNHAAKTAQGVGVIEAIDTAEGVVSNAKETAIAPANR